MIIKKSTIKHNGVRACAKNNQQLENYVTKAAAAFENFDAITAE